MKKFDFIFSVGRDCACAMHLRDNGLRDMSSPFDWLGFIGLEDRIRLMEADFEGFLKKANLRPLDKPRDVESHCDGYLDVATGFEHLHDFPAGVPLDSCFPGVRAKYDRRIRRFRERLLRGGRVLMVWWDKSGQEPDDVYLRAVARIQAKYPACEIHLLAMQNDPVASIGTVVERRLTDRVVKVVGRFCPTPSVRGDVALTAKCLRKVPRSWQIRKKALSRRMRRLLVRFLAVWHVGRAGRRKARELWQRRLLVSDAV